MVTLCVGRGRRTICNGFSLPENCTQIISLFLLQLFIFSFLTPAKFTIMPIFPFFFWNLLVSFFQWLSPYLFSLFYPYIWLCQSIKSQSIINIRLMAPSIPSCLFWDPFISGILTFRHCFVLMEPVSVDQARINLKVVFSFIRRVEKVLTTFSILTKQIFVLLSESNPNIRTNKRFIDLYLIYHQTCQESFNHLFKFLTIKLQIFVFLRPMKKQPIRT